MNSWLFIDKPKNITSFKVIQRLRKILDIKKIGHAGTLDPFATGILAIAIGEATKSIHFFNQDKVYNFKVVFGELVGTYVGVTGTDDSAQEYNDDWSFFDVNENITYTGDFDNDCTSNPNWVGDVGMVGYAFLESPGNPYDGIDNDGDALGFGTAPIFEESDFDEVLIENGSSIVTIDSDFNRNIFLMDESNGATVSLTSQGNNIEIILGETILVEGNIIDNNGDFVVNPNAYDGIDNDLDGLIDENYYLHYRQRKVLNRFKWISNKLNQKTL